MLPVALRKALAIVRDQKRAAYLEASQCRYRLIPDGAQARGYTLWLSMRSRYDGPWEPWGEASHFAVDDILNAQWRVV